MTSGSTRQRMQGTAWLRIAVVAALAVTGLAGFGAVLGPLVFSNVGTMATPSTATLAVGKSVYAAHCASCHGRKLEGQPNWKRQLPSGRLPAPPHDASGHTWHHSDRVLFEVTKRGPAAVVGDGYQSDMPGFAGVLSDDEIRAVLAFIKSTWPQRERQFQDRVDRSEREAKK